MKTTRNSGFSLLEAIVAMGLVSVVLLSQSQVIQSLINQDAHFKTKVNLEHIRQQLLSMLSSPNVLSQTLAAPINTASFDCLKNSTTCSGAKDFALVLGDGSIYYDTYNQNSGFTIDTNVCNTYNLSNSNDLCNIRATLTWKPDCPTGSCINPKRIWINISLSSNSSNFTSINWNSFQISLTQRPQDLGKSDWSQFWPAVPNYCLDPVSIVDTKMSTPLSDNKYEDLKKVGNYLYTGTQNSANADLGGLEIFNMADVANPIAVSKFYATNAMTNSTWGTDIMGITVSSDGNTAYLGTYNGGIIRVDTTDRANPSLNGVTKAIEFWPNGTNAPTRTNSLILDEGSNTLFSFNEGWSGTVALNPNGFSSGTGIKEVSLYDGKASYVPLISNSISFPNYWDIDWTRAINPLIPNSNAFPTDPMIPWLNVYQENFNRPTNPYRIIRTKTPSSLNTQISVGRDWFSKSQLGIIYLHNANLSGNASYITSIKFRGLPGEIIGTYDTDSDGLDDTIKITDILNSKIKTFDLSTPGVILDKSNPSDDLCPSANCRTPGALIKSFSPISDRRTGAMYVSGSNKYLVNIYVNSSPYGGTYPAAAYPQDSTNFPDLFDSHAIIHVTDFTDIANPKLVGKLDIGPRPDGYLRWLRMYNNFIYVMTDSSPITGRPTLYIAEIVSTSPFNLQLKNSIDLSQGNLKQIKISKNTLFATYNNLVDPADTNFVELYDLTDPINPTLYKQLRLPAGARSIEIDPTDNVFVSMPGQIATFICNGQIK